MKYRAANGSGLVYLIGLMLMGLCVSVISVDMAAYYSYQNRMQTAANAASLAATYQMFNTSLTDPADVQLDARLAAEEVMQENLGEGMTLTLEDVVFGYVDPDVGAFDPGTFTTPSNNTALAHTGGYNAVQVIVRRGDGSANSAIPTVLATLMGQDEMNVIAGTTSFMDIANTDGPVISIENGGLIPIYVCDSLWTEANADGDPTNDEITFYGDHAEINGAPVNTNCDDFPSGNWGFADFSDCNSGAVGSQELGEQIANGYPGFVDLNSCYSSSPGNKINAGPVKSALQEHIDNGTIVKVPLYDQFGGSGSNTNVSLSGFAGFQFTDMVKVKSDRYLVGSFVLEETCPSGCTLGEENEGLDTNITVSTPSNLKMVGKI